MDRIAISCIVDDDPKFLMQGWNWLCSLHRLGTPARADLFVHYVETIEAGRLAPFERMAAKLVPIKPFGEGPAAYCNKIRQLDTEALYDADWVILSDADMAFLACPTALASGAAIRGKLVDRPNPPEPVWRGLLARAGFSEPPACGIELNPGTPTFATNLNGGLYVIPRAYLADLRRLWPKWSRFCLDQGNLLGRRLHHSDQLGFGLALLEMNAPVDHLRIHDNFPIHLTKQLDGVAPGPIRAVHYHSEMDDHGLLKRTGIDWIDDQIIPLNRDLSLLRRQEFANGLFWDFRYTTESNLGSGLGSRGDNLLQKRAMLTPYIRAFSQGRILDVGCGDLEVTRFMPARSYHGIDVSDTALAIARDKRPDWRFDATSLSILPDGSYDLVLCLDVLIHQSSPYEFDELIGQCLRISRDAVILSGYAKPPMASAQGIVLFHRPIDGALSQRSCVSSVTDIGSYRDVSVFLATKTKPTGGNRNDISIAELAFGCSETPDWPRLLELVDHSRSKLGFFPNTIIRSIEYPWFATRLKDCRHQSILDIGAGICVLPLWLADQGGRVITIDNHPRVRTPPPQNDWSEWGFIDYATLDSRIKSVHGDVASFETGERFDIIYSVSVLEHMPAVVRRATIANIAKWLAPGGRILLSFDLIPQTDELWPLSQGKIVDRDGEHGRLSDVLSELTAAGLRIVETGTRRAIRGSRTDLAFVEATGNNLRCKAR